jgi:hypothetical protein
MPEEKPDKKTLEEKIAPHMQDLEKLKLLRLSEISISLDTYDDIFSDFDPRPFTERALSEDFLAEMRRACRDKASGQIQVKFLVPRSVRNTFQETLIKRRLREHFKKHLGELDVEKKGIAKRGLYFIITGIAIMFTASAIIFLNTIKSLIVNFLIVLLEPGGWFLFWEGLNQFFFEARKLNPEIKFYKRMENSEITFVSY